MGLSARALGKLKLLAGRCTSSIFVTVDGLVLLAVWKLLLLLLVGVRLDLGVVLEGKYLRRMILRIILIINIIILTNTFAILAINIHILTKTHKAPSAMRKINIS